MRVRRRFNLSPAFRCPPAVEAGTFPEEKAKARSPEALESCRILSNPRPPFHFLNRLYKNVSILSNNSQLTVFWCWGKLVINRVSRYELLVINHVPYNDPLTQGFGHPRFRRRLQFLLPASLLEASGPRSFDGLL